MHNATNQLSGLPNTAAIWHTAWVTHQLNYKKAKQEQAFQFFQSEQGTPI
jgi:hypothetical protein